jgi:hypothetical protein
MVLPAVAVCPVSDADFAVVEEFPLEAVLPVLLPELSQADKITAAPKPAKKCLIKCDRPIGAGALHHLVIFSSNIVFFRINNC